MSDDRELRLAAKANRERLAVAHREVVIQEEVKNAVDVRQNMARLKELRLAKEAQEARTEISKANQRPAPKPKRFR
ncbi:transcriptional regulator (plasmid) [Bradyrhizobium sp. CB82]|uniref:transcriptional regulator n=1 Tax=Bradyrhizobium sp. CB82 TaxID=3039159 RepID=UPI0024B0E979|nr:transcriptional regulator [Bradyrhizobium sp. CB82]WFU45829.1 transcriptional regulator [Bradyrhizobium sp. CB82]